MNNQTPSPKQKALLELSHDQLQGKCLLWFRNEFLDQKYLMHANINNSRDKKQGNRRRAIGVVAGVLDLEYFRKGILYFFDFKVGKDRFSQAQREFMDQVIAEGAICYAIRCLEEFQNIIREINNDHN